MQNSIIIAKNVVNMLILGYKRKQTCNHAVIINRNKRGQKQTRVV